jgi:hypothetical protein
MYKILQFEIKNIADYGWQKISEKDFFTKLLDNFETISMIIIEMCKGKEVVKNFAPPIIDQTQSSGAWLLFMPTPWCS